jgi:hypothetical protein
MLKVEKKKKESINTRISSMATGGIMWRGDEEAPYNMRQRTKIQCSKRRDPIMRRKYSRSNRTLDGTRFRN